MSCAEPARGERGKVRSGSAVFNGFWLAEAVPRRQLMPARAAPLPRPGLPPAQRTAGVGHLRAWERAPVGAFLLGAGARRLGVQSRCPLGKCALR